MCHVDVGSLVWRPPGPHGGSAGRSGVAALRTAGQTRLLIEDRMLVILSGYFWGETIEATFGFEFDLRRK